MFAGFAIGPTIGGWLVNVTDNLLSVNYVILVIYVMLFLFYIFILPESLSKERLAANLKRQQEIRSRQKSWINAAIYRILGALLVFLPQKQQSDGDKIPISFATKYSSLFLAISYTLLSASIMADLVIVYHNRNAEEHINHITLFQLYNIGLLIVPVS